VSWFAQGVIICPQLDCTSPELVLRRGDVSLYLCSARCHREEYPYESSGSYPLGLLMGPMYLCPADSIALVSSFLAWKS